MCVGQSKFLLCMAFCFVWIKEESLLPGEEFSEHKKRIPLFQTESLFLSYFSKNLLFFLLAFLYFEGLRDIEDPGHQEPVEFFFFG